jgi:hypothetical protein
MTERKKSKLNRRISFNEFSIFPYDAQTAPISERLEQYQPSFRSASSIMSGVVKRFKKIPVTLYRLQGRLPVMLRDKATQLAAGRASYDLSLRDDGLVHPAPGTTFMGPNGMSLRPATETMLAISKQFRGQVTVYRLSEGLELPSGLVVLHERDDHFSLQTDEPIALETLNERLTDLLVQCPTQTLPQFIAQLEDVNDQDN